jgi:DNA-binding NarL/FixJ family response regulator
VTDPGVGEMIKKTTPAAPVRGQHENTPNHRVESTTTVALGDFDALVSRGLRELLTDDKLLRVVVFDLGGYRIEYLLAHHRPAVLILDETKVADIAAIERIKSIHPDIAIVMLARDGAHISRARSLLAGVRHLSRDSCASEILSAVRSAADGGGLQHTAELTARESEVMQHLVLGKSYREVADALQIGIETVRTHSMRIRRKLGLQKKRDLIGLLQARKISEADE